MSARIELLNSKLSELEQTRTSAMERLQSIAGASGTKFDLSKQISALNKSPLEIDSRVVGLIALLSTIKGATDSDLIPQRHFNSVSTSLNTLNGHYQTIVANFSSIDGNGGPGNLDSEGSALQSSNGQINFQIVPIFQSIWDSTEPVLVATYPLLDLIRDKTHSEFSAAIQTFANSLEQVAKHQKSLADLLNQASVDQKKITEISVQAIPKFEEIERLRSEGEKDRKTLSEYAGEATQSISTIRATTEQAASLKTSVDVYIPTFENFQKQLDQREASIKSGLERKELLLIEISDALGRINELNKQADAMLSGATVAGLAGSFGKIRDVLSSDLGKARWAFYFSIFLLFVSVTPLAIYIIPGLGELLSISTATSDSHDTSTPQLIGQILARALLLLPAAWLAKFAAGRHAALFRLKEHYAYKYSVASSVEGFKRQAEPYKDAIAAATFFELTFNPAERMDSANQEARHPNPAMEWVMKKIGATYDGKS